MCTVLTDIEVVVGMYRKVTHTDKNLLFDTHIAVQSKVTAVKIVIDLVMSISSSAGKKQERNAMF